MLVLSLTESRWLTMMANYFLWLVVLGGSLIGFIAYLVFRKRTGNDANTLFNLDPGLWIGIVGAIIGALLFLAATGVIPWPTLT